MFKPIIIGGQDISSLRALFDHDDQRIIVPSNRQLIYYNIKSGKQDAVANISPEKMAINEVIVACDRIDANLYLITNYASIFVWNLEQHDWTNELNLPIDITTETLVSCKMLSKRQYLFSVMSHDTKEVNLYYSMSRSERERPKHSELIGSINHGGEICFDMGCCSNEDESKPRGDKSAKQRSLIYIHEGEAYIRRIGIGVKFQNEEPIRKKHDVLLTCTRANPKLPIVAVGDNQGRIFLYSGDSLWGNRTKLHWHRRTVTDLCFSSTGRKLYSAGTEAGCIVEWDLASNTLGQKNVISGLGASIRHINCSPNIRELVLSHEDNEIQHMDTSNYGTPFKTFTRATYDMYLKNDFKALRFGYDNSDIEQQTQLDDVKTNHHSVGLLWHQKTDCLVTNSKTGQLQFYSPGQRNTADFLDCLKSKILTLEKDGRVMPSEITCAAFSPDGDWLAYFETRPSLDGMFPEVKLHVWQRSNTLSRWLWIQTADRLHSTAKITDLKFSPDSKYLVSVAEDGTFQVLFRLNLDSKSENKQMYAKGFFGNVPEGLPSRAAFSQDSSVLAISLKNESTLIWMIVDPYKLLYECQLNREDSESIEQVGTTDGSDGQKPDKIDEVLGLHFGRYESSRGIAPLCEVRSKYIRIWNILNAQSSSAHMMEYLVSDTDSSLYSDEEDSKEDQFTAAAFDQTTGDNKVLEHFAVSTKRNLVHLFELKINQDSRKLQPLIVINGSLSQVNNLVIPRHYTDMCFVSSPIMEIDEKSHQDPLVVNLINRLCLMTNEQELVSFTDLLTFERELAINNCNALKTYELNEVQGYLAKSSAIYQEEMRELATSQKSQPNKSISITQKQRRIKQRLEVQRMLKDLFERIPSHNLPRIDLLGPMILDKLVIE